MEILIFIAIVWLIAECTDIRKSCEDNRRTLRSIDYNISYIKDILREAKEENNDN